MSTLKTDRALLIKACKERQEYYVDLRRQGSYDGKAKLVACLRAVRRLTSRK